MVRIDLKEKMSLKDFEKQFGEHFKYSNKELKQKRIKAAFEKAHAKFD